MGGPYRILGRIGCGGMAEVYQVWDRKRSTQVAIKLLNEDLAEDTVFLRRFAREAAHVCHLLNENAFVESGRGPLHVLALAGPQRLHLRIVDRGRALGDEAQRIFSTQARLFLDFRYRTLFEGVNVTEFAFAYASSGVLVT